MIPLAIFRTGRVKALNTHTGLQYAVAFPIRDIYQTHIGAFTSRKVEAHSNHTLRCVGYAIRRRHIKGRVVRTIASKVFNSCTFHKVEACNLAKIGIRSYLQRCAVSIRTRATIRKRIHAVHTRSIPYSALLFRAIYVNDKFTVAVIGNAQCNRFRQVNVADTVIPLAIFLTGRVKALNTHTRLQCAVAFPIRDIYQTHIGAFTSRKVEAHSNHTLRCIGYAIRRRHRKAKVCRTIASEIFYFRVFPVIRNIFSYCFNVRRYAPIGKLRIAAPICDKPKFKSVFRCTNASQFINLSTIKLNQLTVNCEIVSTACVNKCNFCFLRSNRNRSRLFTSPRPFAIIC